MIKFSGTPILETDRLLLRLLEPSDTQSIFDHWLSDERVADNRVNAAHTNVGQTEERVKKIVSQV